MRFGTPVRVAGVIELNDGNNSGTADDQYKFFLFQMTVKCADHVSREILNYIKSLHTPERKTVYEDQLTAVIYGHAAGN